MPHLDVNGASLYYETDGGISSPAVLLIHAGVATLRIWDPLVPALAADHFVVRFDTRGYGMTETEDVPFSNREDAIDLSPMLAQYEYLASTIPGADGCRFPDSAHLPSVEQPTEFERILLAWLAEHSL
jgi:pimeloyl-ACP methyl ester carboxylesterase